MGPRAAQLPTWPKSHSRLEKSVQSLRGHRGPPLVIPVAFVTFPKTHGVCFRGTPGSARGRQWRSQQRLLLLSSLRAQRPSLPPGSPALMSSSCVECRGLLSSRSLLIIRSPTCSCLSGGGSEPPRPLAPPSSSGGVLSRGCGGCGVGDAHTCLLSLPQPVPHFQTVVGYILPLHTHRADASAVSRSPSSLQSFAPSPPVLRPLWYLPPPVSVPSSALSTSTG